MLSRISVQLNEQPVSFLITSARNSHLIESYLLDRISKNRGLKALIYSIKSQQVSQSASEMRRSLITLGFIESVFCLLVCSTNV